MKAAIKLSKNKRSIILLCFGILALIAGFVGYLYFNAENIQSRIKERICAKVIKREDELLEIVKECPENIILVASKPKNEGDNNQSESVYCYYKELNNEKISRTFRDFNLEIIYNWKDVNGSVLFLGRLSIVNSILWDDYMCGFYYSEEDIPIDVIWTHDVDESETEYVNDFFGVKKYWYRTEKITDNWWFYETKTVYNYKTHR